MLPLQQMPKAKTAIAPLSETLNTRVEVFDGVLKLRGRLNLLTAQVNISSALCVLTLVSASYQASFRRPQSNICDRPAVVEFKDSSEDEDDECLVPQSFAKNQLNLSGMSPGASADEKEDNESEDDELEDECDDDD